jgi:acetyltransferase-like isoleucine patch superfamily enzyme
MMLMNTEFAQIGIGVTIRNGARIECVRSKSSPEPSLSIGDFTHIEQNAHIICRHSVRIGHHVSIAANCAIVDVHHPYEDVQASVPIGLRMDEIVRPVEIGDYSFIGMFSVILPGTKIGHHCVIGAGSIVTKDIPDYCVVSGSPARIIKMYDAEAGEWVRPTDRS